MVIGDMPDRVQDVVGKLQCITGEGGSICETSLSHFCMMRSVFSFDYFFVST